MALRPSVEKLGAAVSANKTLTAVAFVVAVAAIGFALYQIAQKKEASNAA